MNTRNIEHTILGPTKGDTPRIVDECIEADERGLSVCVAPRHAREVNFATSDECRVATVANFPFGHRRNVVVGEEIRTSINVGVDAVDLVVLPSFYHMSFEDDKYQILRSMLPMNADDVLIRLIVEPDSHGRADSVGFDSFCKTLRSTVNAAKRVDAIDGVKTCTGFRGNEAKKHHVAALSNKMPVKASGGIGSADEARTMLDAGATWIGTSSGLEIEEEL